LVNYYTAVIYKKKEIALLKQLQNQFEIKIPNVIFEGKFIERHGT